MNTPFLYKKCTTCGEWKIANTDNFGKDKRGKFGLEARCKVCNKEYHKEYYKNNKDKIKEYHKEYYKNNKDKIKEYYEDNKEHINEYKKQHYENNKEHYKELGKQYYENNKEKIKERTKQHYENNKEHYKEYNKQYMGDNKDKLKEYKKQYREDNKKYFKEYRKQYYENNKEYFKERGKQYHASERGKLVSFNSYNKRRVLMDKQGKGITKEQWLEMMKFFDWKCAYSGETLGIKTRTIDHIAPLAQGGVHEIWNLAPMFFNYNSSKNSRLSVMNWYKEQEYFNEERLTKIVEWQQYAYDKYATEDDDPLILITDLYTGDDDIWLEK